VSRKPNLPQGAIVDAAMHAFWEHGYAISIDGLLRSLGTTRAMLYAHFGSKLNFFVHCLKHYSDTVVTSAIESLRTDAGKKGVKQYFDGLFALGESMGRSGCLMANTMVEFGVTEPNVATITNEHYFRLQRAFARAIGSQSKGHSLAVFANGVWISARSGVPTPILRRAVQAQLDNLILDVMEKP
jgi:AcrR family transcriptional regulator